MHASAIVIYEFDFELRFAVLLVDPSRMNKCTKDVETSL